AQYRRHAPMPFRPHDVVDPRQIDTEYVAVQETRPRSTPGSASTPIHADQPPGGSRTTPIPPCPCLPGGVCHETECNVVSRQCKFALCANCNGQRAFAL